MINETVVRFNRDLNNEYTEVFATGDNGRGLFIENEELPFGWVQVLHPNKFKAHRATYRKNIEDAIRCLYPEDIYDYEIESIGGRR